VGKGRPGGGGGGEEPIEKNNHMSETLSIHLM